MQLNKPQRQLMGQHEFEGLQNFHPKLQQIIAI